MNTGDIDLLGLRSFCALMDERSVSRAAIRLGMAQPTMSRILAKLRAYFGDPLLLWSGGHMVPTPRALGLDLELRQVLVTMERLSSPAQAFDPATSAGTIRLVATGYLENIFLAKVMGEVATQAPRLEIETRPPNQSRDAAALETGEVDFLIGWNMRPAEALRSRLLFTDKLVCIARADHPELRDDALTYDKFVRLPHIQYEVPSRTTTAQLLEERLSQDGYRQDVRFRVQNFITVAEVVSSSNMISTLSRRFVTGFLQTYPIKMLELPIRLPPMRNSVFWHERMQADPRNRWFRKLLVEVAKRSIEAEPASR
jgi:DNA-binding transcriptional LysR family regulator